MFIFLSRQELKPASKPGSRRGSLNPDSKEDAGGEVIIIIIIIINIKIIVLETTAAADENSPRRISKVKTPSVACKKCYDGQFLESGFLGSASPPSAFQRGLASALLSFATFKDFLSRSSYDKLSFFVLSLSSRNHRLLLIQKTHDSNDQITCHLTFFIISLFPFFCSG